MKSQIFGPISNLLSKLSVFGVFLALAAFIVILVVISRSPYPTWARHSPTQPVPFNHALHAGSLKIECRYCHTAVEQSSFAGIPATETCMTCHSQILTTAAELQPVRDSWQTGEPIPWNRVHELPDYVYFNHSIHVAKGVGCSTCHGRVDQMAQIQQIQPLTMGWCLSCHRDPAPYLRPPDQVFNMEWTPPPDQIARGRQLLQDEHIQMSRLTNCSTCHR